MARNGDKFGTYLDRLKAKEEQHERHLDYIAQRFARAHAQVGDKQPELDVVFELKRMVDGYVFSATPRPTHQQAMEVMLERAERVNERTGGWLVRSRLPIGPSFR
jgi:hypothetical protein